MLTTDKELDIIFDRFGAARLRLLKTGEIVSWHGHHLGFLIDGQIVHGVSGQHVGWYENGVLRDGAGNTVGFGVNPTDDPLPFLPVQQALPTRGNIKGSEERTKFGDVPHPKPIKTFGWSPYDPVQLFGGA